jgi:CRISPR-associated exonuclease Cas4
VGKPDYILQRRGQTIPVEVKPGRQESQPYPSDIMQLAAYCLLIEDVNGVRPPYGLLRYAHTTFQVRYDRRLRDDLLAILTEMQTADPLVSAIRSHDDQGRCGGCGFVGQCTQALR